MKSTMKSAFAFIAVALMIMVAVVPMVSVFTEENGVDATVAAKEYDNSVADPIIISGTVKENTTGLTNVPVKVTCNSTTPVTVYTDATGKYTLETSVAVGTAITQVKIEVDATTAKVNGLANEAYGKGFPTVTAENVTDDITLDVIANTAKVSGKLVTKSNTDVYITGASITATASTGGTTISGIKTVNGAFEFYGVIGTEYTISTGSDKVTTFKADKFTLGNEGKNDVALVAQGNILTLTLSTVPVVPTFAIAAATGDNVNGISSLGAGVLGTNGSAYYAYSLITYSTAAVAEGKTLAATKVNLTYTLTAEKSYIELSAAMLDADRKVVAADDTATSSLSYIATGDMTVGDVTVAPSSVSISARSDNTAASAFTKNATIVGKKWYVQSFFGYDTTSGDAISLKDVSITGTLTGYAFNTLNGSGTFAATNAVKVSGSIDAFPTGVYTYTLSITATNYVASLTGLVLNKAVGAVEEKLTYEFYVPKNTSVTVTAPENYTPSKYVNDKVTTATAVEQFVYDSSVESTTYTGKITLNGVSITNVTKLAYSIDGGKTFAAFTPEYVSGAYSLTVSSSIDPKDIFVKVAYDYTDGYAFEKTYMKAITSGNDYYYNFYGVTDTTIESIPVEADDVVVTIKDADSTVNVIAGQKVNFYMSTASDYAGLLADKYSVDLGSATTDAYGVATIEAAKVITSDSYNIFAVPEGDATLGAYVFASGAIAAMDGITVISSTSKTTSGTVMDSYGAIVSEPKISYIEYSAADIVLGEGSAKVVDGKYYIVTGAAVDKVVIKIDGYNFNTATSKEITVGSTTTDITGVVANTPTVTKYSVTYDGNNSHVNVPVDSYKKGTVITFSADSEYTVEDTENIYSDGYTKYTFKAWYVNGKQVSTDAVTSYTVGDENVVVSADYTVEHVSVADGKADKGIDNNVLIIGIAAVIVALIAVVYAVVKKE